MCDYLLKQNILRENFDDQEDGLLLWLLKRTRVSPVESRTFSKNKINKFCRNLAAKCFDTSTTYTI